MSGAGENRSSWQRPQGRGNRASGSNNPGKDGGRQQAMSALSGNAWKGKGQGGGERAQAQTTTVPADQHIPVKDFNAGEVKEFLKKSNMPHLMPSGQDFFTQLKKQLVSLDQAKPS
ncbi:hypothetical protein SLS60_000955 [Paraconiothyrium brasiliense]|uniref:Uncharacterized protein n=1 Tax=Paraconiothyrium brasiliense TaxID=300254 RepID=A0ABR3S7Q4_9PLEO